MKIDRKMYSVLRVLKSKKALSQDKVFFVLYFNKIFGFVKEITCISVMSMVKFDCCD